MNDCVSVFLTGVGGQGILLASEIISNAAMLSGFDVKTNEVHGMAQRGGTVTALVRYGPKVYSPLICEGDARVLCAFEMAEAIRAAHYLAPGGLAVVNQYRIIPVTVSSGSAIYPEDIKETLRKRFPRLCYFDATQKAIEAGTEKAANVVLLGATSVGLDLPEETWLEAIRKTVKPKFLDVNLKAFTAGRAAAQ
ncbi:MAG: indolepyruvate oxidoreductase subunit beta [Verrucomicrobiae bacterium]|jgi:indolepyruvate ferredoxin oxidoreductase, beta subunit|nr:indolepyruvate oxidoreductase subunit beta [Verrucomicrobiae bacterium]